jgi:hypothetical protein
MPESFESHSALAERIRDAVTDALRYWEPRRVPYNLVLAAIVIGYFIENWPDSRAVLSFDAVFALFILAVIANVCYCAAYVADVFVQVSGFRHVWVQMRWVVFAMGLIVAAIFTRWLSLGFLASGRQ